MHHDARGNKNSATQVTTWFLKWERMLPAARASSLLPRRTSQRLHGFNANAREHIIAKKY
jgi:hypothetical protein